MIKETECEVALVGMRHDTFYLTLSDPNGNMQAWTLTPDKFDAMMMRCHEASISYRVARLREAAAKRLADARQPHFESDVDYKNSPDLD